MRDLSYNVHVEYYEMPWIPDNHGSFCHPNSIRKSIKTMKNTFDIIKEKNINSLLPIKDRKSYNICTIHEDCYLSNRAHGREQLFDSVPVINTVPSPSIAETSDKFVAILNIVKQQDERIKDLEMRLKQDCM